MSRQYYQKASHIETRNGRPFNQLAILASTTKRKFEAVYYNMRCLQSKNPFTSSQGRDSPIVEQYS
jgi:protein SMG6